MNGMKNLIIIFLPQYPQYQSDENLKVIPEIVEDFMNSSNKYYVELANALDEEKDTLKQSINALSNDSKDTLHYLSILINNTKISNCLKNALKLYPNLSNLIYILPNLLPDDKDIEIYDMDLIYNFTKKHYEFLIDLGIAFGQNYFSHEQKSYQIIGSYLENDTNDFMVDCLEIIVKTNLTNILPFILPIDAVVKFCDYINKNLKDFEDLYNITKEYDKIPEKIALILKNLGNKEEIMRIIFSDSLMIGKKGLMKIIVGIAFQLIPQNKRGDNFMDILMGFLRGGVRLYRNYFGLNITKECEGLVDYAFLGDLNETKGLSLNLSSFFVYKLLIDSTKNKNDLLTYDNCLYKPPIISKINIDNVDENGVVPAFIITSCDRTIEENKNLYKVSTEIESKYFVSSFCFPQGINKGNSNKYAINGTYLHCTNEDYSLIIKEILALFVNVDKAKLHTISIKKKWN
jgi:hypothetical protein